MIGIERGADLSAFLDKIVANPGMYSEVIVCAPFIDAPSARRLCDLAARARRSSCGLTIITSSRGGAMLNAIDPDLSKSDGLKVRVWRNLHAKAYLAVTRGRRPRSEAIITSANLTAAAFSTNLELGIRANSRSAAGRALVAQVRQALSILSN